MKRKGITWRDPKLVDEQSPLTCQQSKLNKNKTQQQPAPELLLKCGLRPVKLCKLPPIITKDSGTPFHLPFSLKMQHPRGRAGRGPPDTGRPGLSAEANGNDPVRWPPESRARRASPQRVGLGQRGSAGSSPLWLGPLATCSTPPRKVLRARPRWRLHKSPQSMAARYSPCTKRRRLGEVNLPRRRAKT